MASTINASTSSGIVQTADTSGILQLQTANTTAVTIDASQNVGVGTTSPNQSSSGKALTVNASSGYAALELSSGNSSKWYINTDGSATYDVVVGNQPRVFYVNGAERMRIAPDANTLLIGATSFSSTTSGTNLNGNGIGQTAVGNFNLSLYKPSGDAQTAYLVFFWNNGLAGYINYNGTGVNYNSSSDARLKENVVDSPSALNILDDVKVRAYDWISESTHDDFGFVAQELYEVYPKAVTPQKDKEDGSMDMPWAVDYAKLVPVLVKAVQELKAELDATKAEVAALKGNV